MYPENRPLQRPLTVANRSGLIPVRVSAGASRVIFNSPPYPASTSPGLSQTERAAYSSRSQA